MTQSPIASISPSSSAIGMNSPGGTILRGIAPPDHASRPVTEQSARSTTVASAGPSVDAPPHGAVGWSATDARRRRRPLENTTEPPGSAFFDWYMAVSAFFNRLVASVASCGKRLTPSEADVKNSTPPRSNGSWRPRAPGGHGLGDEQSGFRAGHRADPSLEVGEQQEELVATLARDQVRFAGAPAETFRELLQELVPGVVAERVVHELEVVEVEVEHSHAEVMAARARSRLPASPRRAPGSAGRSACRGTPGRRPAPRRACAQ